MRTLPQKLEHAFLELIENNHTFYSARDYLTSEFEKYALMWLLEKTQGNVSAAARLGQFKDRTGIYFYLDIHNIDPELYRIPHE